MEVIKNGIKYYFRKNNFNDENLYFKINWETIQNNPKNKIELKNNYRLARIKEFKKYYNCKYKNDILN